MHPKATCSVTIQQSKPKASPGSCRPQDPSHQALPPGPLFRFSISTFSCLLRLMCTPGCLARYIVLASSVSLQSCQSGFSVVSWVGKAWFEVERCRRWDGPILQCSGQGTKGSLFGRGVECRGCGLECMFVSTACHNPLQRTNRCKETKSTATDHRKTTVRVRNRVRNTLPLPDVAVPRDETRWKDGSRMRLCEQCSLQKQS
jgi:hypothetical protein